MRTNKYPIRKWLARGNGRSGTSSPLPAAAALICQSCCGRAPTGQLENKFTVSQSGHRHPSSGGGSEGSDCGWEGRLTSLSEPLAADGKSLGSLVYRS